MLLKYAVMIPGIARRVDLSNHGDATAPWGHDFGRNCDVVRVWLSLMRGFLDGELRRPADSPDVCLADMPAFRKFFVMNATGVPVASNNYIVEALLADASRRLVAEVAIYKPDVRQYFETTHFPLPHLALQRHGRKPDNIAKSIDRRIRKYERS